MTIDDDKMDKKDFDAAFKELCKPDYKKLYEGYRRDAMYYEKCLRDYRDKWMQGKGLAIGTPEDKDSAMVIKVADNQISFLDTILAAEYEPEGVDLDKPNYGMF